MPKKAKSGSRTAARKDNEVTQGYYVYSNGDSNWGDGIWHGSHPLLATKEVHNKTVEEKIAWFEIETADIKKAKAEVKK